MAVTSMRKALLLVHVPTSVGLLGAVISFLTLAIAGLAGMRGIYPAADLLARYAVLPLTIAALAVGVVQALVGPWGMFRHYWVVAKLMVTALVLAVLMMQLPGVSWLGSLSADQLDTSEALAVRMSLVLHSAGGLVPILLAAALSIYKPRGLTRYGWSKHRAAR